MSNFEAKNFFKVYLSEHSFQRMVGLSKFQFLSYGFCFSNFNLFSFLLSLNILWVLVVSLRRIKIR